MTASQHVVTYIQQNVKMGSLNLSVTFKIRKQNNEKTTLIHLNTCCKGLLK